MAGITELISVSRIRQNAGSISELSIVRETNISLSVNGKIWFDFLCSPDHLVELGVGFLYNEGFIKSLAEVVSSEVCQQGTLMDIWLAHAVTEPDRRQKTSGCGGGYSIAENNLKPLSDEEKLHLSNAQIWQLLDAFYAAQVVYREAGGIHATSFASATDILYTAEDIGRHNTLDKLAGIRLLEAPSELGKVILTTGRISSEMMEKAVRLRAAWVISRTSPTQAAVDIARQAGVVLAGYVRKGSAIIYTDGSSIA